MPPPQPQRARQPHQKAARRQAMLDAARDLMALRPFEEIAVRDIPDRLGLAKGTVYRYFDSKEEVFLSVLQQDLAEFSEAVVADLADLESADDIDAVVDVITSRTVERPRMCKLMALLPTVLEQNVSEPAARAFKTTVAEVVADVGRAVGLALPCIDAERMPGLVVTYHSLLTGLWAMAHPHPAVISALKTPELAFLRIDFGTHLRSSLRAMLLGNC